MSGVGLFIDGAHLRIRWKEISPELIDFGRLRAEIEARCRDRVTEAYCFDATENGCTNALFNAMGHAGIRVKLYEYAFEDVFDDRRQRVLDKSGKPVRRRVQKGVDVGLAMGLVDSHQRCGWTQLVLASADADFAEPVQRLVERHGVRLTLLGIPERVSHALRPYAADAIDLREIAPKVERPRLATAV